MEKRWEDRGGRRKPERAVREGIAVIRGLLLMLAVAPVAAVDFTTLENKVLFGYQGWFHCTASGGSWTHWSRGTPTPATLTVDMYPDLREFSTQDLCPAGSMTIGGKPAYLFSSQNPRLVDAHFRWMKEYGLDGVLVQRFIGETARKRSSGDVVLKNIMAAALAHGRTFAIEYDVTGGQSGSFQGVLQADWAYLVDELKVTAHPTYLHHAGKPVLSVWGMGLNEGHPPTTPAPAQALVDWFRTGAPARHQVTYIGGTPSGWRTLNADARPEAAWRQVYQAMDVVQPWTVGRYTTLSGVDAWRRDRWSGDVALRKTEGKLYMPVIFPGFSWYNLKDNARQNQIPRLGGRFLWRQAYQARSAGATMLKIAMYDEVDESTAMFKLASRRIDAPDQGYWLTLDADGHNLPSDWYLRLAGEITRMFQGTRPVDSAMPVNPGGTSGALPDGGGERHLALAWTCAGDGLVFTSPAGVALRLFDPAGRSLRTLRFEQGRSHWDGRDARGAILPPGVYLARLEPAGPVRAAYRLVLP